MIQLAANLSTLFAAQPFLDRIDAAAAAGFRAVECQFPYEVAPEAIAARLADCGLEWVLFNTPPGRPEAGERGVACLPGREADFLAGVRRACDYVRASGCRRVHVMAGLVPQGMDRARCLDQFIANLARAADLLGEAGAVAMIEPINTRVDVPGYLLDGTSLALECIERCRRDNVQLQFDVYHMQIMQGDLIRSLRELLPFIGHIQIADNPGRHEPGTGEINFEVLLREIDAMGYTGHVGCEYLPAADTLAGLGWARAWLAPR